MSRWPFRRVLRLQRRVEEDVDAELAFHLEGRVEELVAQGLPRAEAEAEARRRFGDVARVREAVAAIDRPARRSRALHEAVAAWGRDARLGLRQLAQHPAHAAVVVATLAVALGANAALFSAVHAVLLRPLPLPHLERTVVLRDDLPGLGLRDAEVSPGEAVDLLARTDLFERAAAWVVESPALTGQGEARQLTVTRTLGDYFGLLGARPLLGRLHAPEESDPGAPRVLVLSHGLWRELGGEPAWVGRTLTLDGVAHTVVGVLPPDFRPVRPAQAFAPFALEARQLAPGRRHSLFVTLVARVREGLGPEALAQALAGEARAWRERFPEGYGVDPAFSVRAVPVARWLAGDLRGVLLVLMAAVGVVLLVASANVAGLQLVRTVGRAREMAVRAALGSGRWPLVRQVLVETGVLALAGGVAGVALGQALVGGLARLDPVRSPQLQGLALSVPVLAFTAAVTLGAALVAGLGPALRAGRAAPADALRAGSGGAAGGRSRLLGASVVAQVALTLPLLLGAAWGARALQRALEASPGFAPHGVATLRASLPGRYADGPARTGFYGAVLERLRGVAGVRAVAAVSDLPFTPRRNSTVYELPGRPRGAGAPQLHADLRTVAGDAFGALGIPLRAGRRFGPQDGPAAPGVVVVDETLAREVFPGEDPLGKQLLLGRPLTVVGVVGAVSHARLGEWPKATLYLPYAQSPWSSALTLVVRGDASVEALAAAARADVREQDADVPVFEVQSLEALVAQSLGPQRLGLGLLASFAGVALLLAALGLYGVVSYGARQRTRELGIRVALGAQPRDVVGLVLRRGLALTGGGVALGGALFVALSRGAAAVVGDLGRLDAVAAVTALTALGAVALAASWLPARRTARLPPAVALRRD